MLDLLKPKVDADLQQAALLLVQPFSAAFKSIPIVRAVAEPLHVLINVHRTSNDANPKLDLVLNIITEACIVDDALADLYYGAGLILSAINILARASTYTNPQRIVASKLIGVLIASRRADDYMHVCSKILSHTVTD